MICFKQPNVYEASHNRASVTYEKDMYVLRVCGQVMMKLNPENNNSYTQLMGSVWLARGKTICTGLGLLLRESMLLSNPLVTSVTVIESSQDLIELQRVMNPELMDQLNIIQCDANRYEGECDTLLVDHYEQLDQLKTSVDSAVANINHERLWFWTLETSIKNYQTQREKYPTIPQLNNTQVRNLVQLYSSSIDIK